MYILYRHKVDLQRICWLPPGIRFFLFSASSKQMGIPWRFLQTCSSPDKQIRSLRDEQLLVLPDLALQEAPWELESREGRERRQYECSMGILSKTVIEIPW